MVVIHWPLPDTEELTAILVKCDKDLPSKIPVKLNGNREAVIQAIRGLSAFKAGSVLLSDIAATSELSESCIPYIVAEKSHIVGAALEASRQRQHLPPFLEKDLNLQPNQGLQYLIRLGTGDAPTPLCLPLAGLVSTVFHFDGMSIASLQLVPKYPLNLRIDTKSSFGINSVPGFRQ